MFFLKKLFSNRELIRQRNQALQDAKKFGFHFEATFSDWQLPASQAYSRKTSNSSPSGFESDCRREVERIISVAFRPYSHNRSQYKLRYSSYIGKETSNSADVIIEVKLNGVGLKGGPYKDAQGRQGYAMTGAQITGTISLCPGDLLPISRSFKGTISPPTSIPQYQAWGSPPFRRAIAASQLEKILQDILSKLYPQSKF